MSNMTKVTPDNTEKPTETEAEMPVKEAERKNLADKGSDVNVMPYSTYMKHTDERPTETDVRLSLARHSYVYPLGIAKDVLVEVAEH
ncbi:hypothetical protein Tco_0571961, partial [Tanacetum coccineum]